MYLNLENNVVSPTLLSDVPSPVSFALGNVDCSEDSSIMVELISLSQKNPTVKFEGVTFNNKTSDLSGFMKSINVSLSVSNINLYNTAYIYEYLQGKVCDDEYYCLPIICN